MAESLMSFLANEYGNSNDVCLEDADYLEDKTARNLITSELRKVNITSVKVIRNNYLRGMYELKKLEYKSRGGYVEEKLLVHATSARNVTSIIENNLDWRRVQRSKYGKGVSFSPDADYANYHSNICNGSARAFIIAKVLVKQTIGGSSTMVIPPRNYDTSTSNNGKVYVKYNDNEFLLKYVVYYDAPDRSESKHHRAQVRRLSYPDFW